MIYNVNDLAVEIDGEIFPAVNIQIPASYPELSIDDAYEFEFKYGIYFELMFEDGGNATVYQTATDDSDAPLDHFTVKFSWMQNHFCTTEDKIAIGEAKLAQMLKFEKLLHRPFEAELEYVLFSI